jgi:hypothetical protein
MDCWACQGKPVSLLFPSRSVALDCQRTELSRCQWGQINKYFVASDGVCERSRRVHKCLKLARETRLVNSPAAHSWSVRS